MRKQFAEEIKQPFGGAISVIVKIINMLKFRWSVFRMKRSHKRMLKYYIQALKFCLRNINKIGAPVNESENDTLKRLLVFYDETVADINKEVDRHRHYAWDQHIQ